ncbi:CPBP family intramembrane glutamic endopeptidase [Actinomadura meridiana]|uniref:CPBP family intramembrane glutamic endopeptidase n=1 Tax=Actinomadura meridiana TaxID=559626 RepID=UPI0031EE8548
MEPAHTRRRAPASRQTCRTVTAPEWSLRHAVAAPFVALVAMAVTAVVTLIVLAAAGAVPDKDDQDGQLVVNAACVAVGGLIAAWTLSVWRHRRARPRLTDFALVPSPRSPGVVIGWTLGAGATLMLVMAAYALLVPARQDTAVVVRDAHGAQLAVLVVLVVVLAPVNEEVLCRGVIYAGLRSWRGPWCAAPVTALLFAVPHADWKLMPVLLAAGGALAVVRERTGSLAPAIALHSGLNSAAICTRAPLLTAALTALMLTVCAVIAFRPRPATKDLPVPPGTALSDHLDSRSSPLV